MSGLEIERKFLVKKGDAYKSAAFSSSHIQQGYIPAGLPHHQGKVGERRYDSIRV